jgi:hypothetical protein
VLSGRRNAAHPLATCCGHKTKTTVRKLEYGASLHLPISEAIRRDEARIDPDHWTPSLLVKQIIWRLSSGPGHEATVSPSSSPSPSSHASTSLECLSSLTPPNQAARNHHSLTHQQFIAIVQCEASLTTISIDTAHGEDTSSSITNSHLIN